MTREQYIAALTRYVDDALSGNATDHAPRMYALIMRLDAINARMNQGAGQREKWKAATMKYAASMAPRFGLSVVSGVERALPAGDWE